MKALKHGVLGFTGTQPLDSSFELCTVPNERLPDNRKSPSSTADDYIR